RRLASTIGVASLLALVVLTVMLIKRARTPDQAAAVTRVPVVEALAPVRAKERLSSYSGKFHLVTKPQDQTTEDALQRIEDVDGKYALSSIDAGAIVKRSQVVPKEGLGTISSTLRPGYEAM